MENSIIKHQLVESKVLRGKVLSLTKKKKNAKSIIQFLLFLGLNILMS